ncbi:hypothetical protein JTB14_027636 [Gonioctena quinquepunctata]|nr:hypothetical protein JTB14_027636 [Gonioctena quinquepunctata]
MSEEQLGDLQTAILDAIDKIEVGAFRPQFLECFRKKGALVLDCNNQESIDWLKNSVQSLTPWEGAQFRVIQPGKTVVQKVIVHNEYPLKVLSSEQIDNLQSDLVKVVEELPSNDFVPLFLNCVRQRGTLLVDCNDQESADWLRSSVPDVLVAWDGPELIIADPEKIPYRKYLQLCIPDPGEEPERILSRLQRQNKGINSKDWHFVRKKKEKNSTSLFVAVDDEVSKALKAVGFKLFLNFGRIMVKDLGKFRPILERKPKKSDDSIKQTEDKNVSKMDLSSEDLTEILTEVDELLTEVENQETKE